MDTARIGVFSPGVFFALPMSEPPTSTQRRRAMRVWMLVGTIVVLSLADLYMTLAHLRSVGMGEGNPLARLVMSYHSPLLLCVWKCTCIALTTMILILTRFRRSGEIACWVSCLVLTALTIQWTHYSAEASSLTRQINEMSGPSVPANWVSMGQE
jgi:hypothetical protein